jgi:four helix bundle protein
MVAMEGRERIGLESYRELKVWQQAMDLAVQCYDATRNFPKDEMFGLTSQIRRSAASIAANVAEGHGRESTGAFVQSLRVAQGSLKELETHIILAGRLKLIGHVSSEDLLKPCDAVGKMLRSLIRSLQRRIAGASANG